MMGDESWKAGLVRAERDFVSRLLIRHPKARWFRHGWPDFLLEENGKTFAVEVKFSDGISKRQARMFEALESAGIPVFIWNPRHPNALTPWRSYREAQRQNKLTRRRQKQERIERGLHQGMRLVRKAPAAIAGSVPQPIKEKAT